MEFSLIGKFVEK